MAQMNIGEAHIIALWLRSIFYGMNSILVWACLFVLTRRRRQSEDISKFLIIIVIAQYLVSTADVALALEHVVTGFINNGGQGTTSFFTYEPNPVNVADLLCISTNSILNDVVIVWRCYCVWGKNWNFVALPTMLVVATIACAIGQGISFRTLKDSHNIFSPKIVPWNSSLYALSLSTNVICTSLIAFRIWTLLRRSSMKAAYSKLLILIVESGMLYSAALIIGLGLYATHSVSFFIVYDQFGQISSIIPTMILLLVGLKLTSNDVHLRISTKSTMPIFANNSQGVRFPPTYAKPVSSVGETSANLTDPGQDIKLYPLRRDDAPPSV